MYDQNRNLELMSECHSWQHRPPVSKIAASIPSGGYEDNECNVDDGYEFQLWRR